MPSLSSCLKSRVQTRGHQCYKVIKHVKYLEHWVPSENTKNCYFHHWNVWFSCSEPSQHLQPSSEIQFILIELAIILSLLWSCQPLEIRMVWFSTIWAWLNLSWSHHTLRHILEQGEEKRVSSQGHTNFSVTCYCASHWQYPSMLELKPSNLKF